MRAKCLLNAPPQRGGIGLFAALATAAMLTALGIYGVESAGESVERARSTEEVSDSAGNSFEAVNRETGMVRLGVEVFRARPGGGFGYRISTEDGTVIHQPHPPALPGTTGFASKEDARNVADLVAARIRAGVFPPAVSPKDLDSLGIRIVARFPDG